MEKVITGIQSQNQLSVCPVCGGTSFTFNAVLWRDLIEAWGLSEDETSYIDRQQGLQCNLCRCNLRSMTLASGLMQGCGFTEGTFSDFCSSSMHAEKLQLLEINEAGNLTSLLSNFKHYTYVAYPETDMQNMAGFGDEMFDLVVHSDTLEHVPQPLRALQECRRILRPGGLLAYTVPVVIGRLSRTREGSPPSYHGAAGCESNDMRVITEYGSDFWCEPMVAGFKTVTLHRLLFPDSIAILSRA